jgi:hypothetical protein
MQPLPSIPAYFPDPHELQLPNPSEAAVYPAGQAMHWLVLVAEYRPEGHTEQLGWPSLPAYQPVGQVVQVSASEQLPENVPAAHALHEVASSLET